MSIQIIDGFQVNAATPIDNRIVASGSSARNDIPYKYEGLRVFDTSDSIPYVWLNNTWVSENATGIVGSGSASFFPLYTSSNVVGSSSLQEIGGGLIRTVDSFGVNKITINASTGLLSATNLSGAGSAITNILGSNITGNSISVSGLTSKITPSGTTNQVLVSDISFTNWRNLSDVTVGTASIASQVRVTGTDFSNVNRPITFIDTINVSPINNTVKANSNLTYNPFTRTLVTGTVSSNRVVTTGDVRVGTNLNCVGGLIDIGNTSGVRNAYVFSGNTGVLEFASYFNRPIIFSTGNTSLNERMRITNAGISQVNTSFISHGSFAIGTGTEAETTKITITSQTYDRIIYMYGSNNSNNYYLTGGWLQLVILVGAQQVYSCFFGSDNDFRPSFGYSYILPAGLASTIRLQKSGLTYNTGTTGTTIFANSLKFGR